MFIWSCPSLSFTKNYSRSAFLARSDHRCIASQSIEKYIIIIQWNIGSVVVIITARQKRWGRWPQQDHHQASSQCRSHDNAQQCQTMTNLKWDWHCCDLQEGAVVVESSGRPAAATNTIHFHIQTTQRRGFQSVGYTRKHRLFSKRAISYCCFVPQYYTWLP